MRVVCESLGMYSARRKLRLISGDQSGICFGLVHIGHVEE
jgi:hypothetical protein